jgi:hypothetical protein
MVVKQLFTEQRRRGVRQLDQIFVDIPGAAAAPPDPSPIASAVIESCLSLQVYKPLDRIPNTMGIKR